MQDFTFAFVEPHKDPVSSLFYPSNTPLNGMPALQCRPVHQSDVIHKRDAGPFCFIVQAINEDFKQYRLQYKTLKNITCN